MAPGGRAGTALAARWTGCPVDWPAATGLAIAAAAMPKRKKQDQPPPLPQQQQHLALSERDEPGDEEDERPMGQPSVNYSPEGRRGEKNYDGPTVKDHPAFWALPPWLTGSLVIPSQNVNISS
ncbi:mCG141134, isoform CRA_d [Mus musculus]|nr:mCG141134, isoform CRA_d [Mus musculus]|eukprot:NP_001268954.1 proline-rich protein 3 isoform d [Mus musculus]